MNRKQRDKNRDTASALRFKLPPKTVCPECGELTHGHFFTPCFGDEGFWVCSKFYGEDGRCLADERGFRTADMGLLAAVGAVVSGARRTPQPADRAAVQP